MTRHLKTNAEAIKLGVRHLTSLDSSLKYVEGRSFHTAKDVTDSIVADQESICAAVKALEDVEGTWPNADDAKRLKLATEQRRVIARFSESKYEYYSPNFPLGGF